MNPNPEKFKQANPKDQLQVILMALEGNLENWHDGIINKQQFYARVGVHLVECKSLQPFLAEDWEPVCVNCNDQGCDFCGPDEPVQDCKPAFDERL